MKFYFLLCTLLLSACSSLNISEIPDNSKILVIADTVDKFHLVFDADAFFPINREIYVSELTPPWRLSDLFVDKVMMGQNKSRFKLIKGENSNIRGDEPLGKYNRMDISQDRLISLSQHYDAKYIFVLKTHRHFKIRGSSTILNDMEYGYEHFVTRPLFSLSARGMIRVGLNIFMYKVEKINNEPMQKERCVSAAFGESYFGEFTEPMDIPMEVDKPLLEKEINKFELEKIFKSSKIEFEKLFQKAIEECLYKEEYRTKTIYQEPDVYY
jgi:hypothetical protein